MMRGPSPAGGATPDERAAGAPATPGGAPGSRRLSWPRWLLRNVLDWLPLFVALFVYDEVNNRLGPYLPKPHTFPQIRFDQALCGGEALAVRMQRALYTPGHPHAWDWFGLVVYNSHFFVPTIGAIALRIVSRARFHRYLAYFLLLTTLGFATYIAFPAVPPWLASQYGDLAPTHRIVRELWAAIGRPDLAALFSGSNVYANDIAAIPSLHAAYTLLLAVFFWRGAKRWMRAALVLYAVAMPVVLIYFAEHYVLDILLGWAYVGVTLLLMKWLWPRGRLGAAPA